MTRDERITQIFKQRLIAARVPVREAILFGSRARRKHERDSDLDVCLILDHLDDSIERAVSSIAWEVGYENNRVIVTVEYSRAQLRRSPVRASPFLKAVLREGIRV